MPLDWTLFFRLPAFLGVLCLPGAWVMFGLPLTALSFWARLAASVALSPLVILVEFYGFRLVGLSFETTVWLIVLVNLPALLLIARHRKAWTIPPPRAILAWACVLFLPLVLFAPQILDAQTRAYTGHAWMHADVVYLIANGALVPEDPELAGIHLAYPWAGHVYQAVLSFVLNSTPVSSFIWTNLIWVGLTWAFVAGVVHLLGGNLLARVSSVIWLAFGVNIAGYLLLQFTRILVGSLPESANAAAILPWVYLIAGDVRYSPWLLRSYFFQQEEIALGIFAALAYFLLRRLRLGSDDFALLIIGLLLCSAGLLYPVLFPAAAALAGIAVSMQLFGRFPSRRSGLNFATVALSWLILAAGIITFWYVAVITQDSRPGAVALWGMKTSFLHVISAILVTSPLVAGLVWTWRHHAAPPGAILLLVLGALASAMFLCVFKLRGIGGVEYKFMFTLAICLAPFAALGSMNAFNRFGRPAILGFAALATLLAVPLIDAMSNGYPWLAEAGLSVEPPRLELAGFDLNLAPGERFGDVTTAIRTLTPVESVLVVRNGDLHFPTLTQRTLYAPPIQSKPHPGINIIAKDLLVDNKGYSPELVTRRRRIVNELYSSPDDTQREQALGQLLSLKRPLVILLARAADASLEQWLGKQALGKNLFEDKEFSVWLVSSDSIGHAARFTP